jgi:23S rRNA (uracil1939-C5)-methyltransferase
MRVIEGRVRGFAKEGDAVVETAQGLVFAPFGMPGERVRLEDVHKEGKVLRARHLRVIEASADRVTPACVHVARCGGCPLMHASAEAQRLAKLALVERALTRVPRRSNVEIRFTTAETVLGYRQRARFAWKRTGQGIALGFRARRREIVVDIDRCVVLRPELERAWAIVRKELAPHLPGSGELQLAIGNETLAVIGIETEDAPSRALFQVLEKLVEERAIAGASVRAGGASIATRMGDPRQVSADAEGRPILGEAFGFNQAHAEINASLGRRALELAEPKDARVLELYAGHGNLTLGLAARASFVCAVELNSGATSALAANLEMHELTSRVRVITGDATRHVSPARGEAPWDVVVLDPPRTGAKEAMGAIADARPERVVYVSCDPATLGRDLEMLGRAGYELDVAEAFDMFPQTAHVETVARMRRV